MQWIAAMFLFACSLASLQGEAAELSLSLGSAETAAWRADGITLTYLTPTDLRINIDSITLPGKPPLKNFRLHCAASRSSEGVQCERADFSATLPGWGKITGQLRLRFDNAQHWHAELQVPAHGLSAVLDQRGAPLQVLLSLRQQALADVAKLATALGYKLPGEASGDVDVTFTRMPGDDITAQIQSTALNFSEPTGKYASDKFAGTATLHWQSKNNHGDVDFDGSGGQAYVEPLFLDFGVLPLHAKASFMETAQGWQIETLRAEQGKAGTLQATGVIGKDYQPLQLDARIEASDLAPLVTTDLLPFLIGGTLDGVTASGRAAAQITLRAGKLQNARAQLDGAGFNAAKLGVALDGLHGTLDWSTVGAAASELRWQGGSLMRVPLGPSDISFRVQGQDFELLSPWRQPLLEGALKVQKLVLRNLGGAQLNADFEGALEPLNLAALCAALKWPQFGGTLGGRLPGLSVRDDVWSIDGALDAQVFDGSVRIENLRAIEPFGVLPRVMADITLRRLDLERLTGAFSFGRITGRLDGDITGLRLLRWSPVSFDGRVYSTPGDNTGKRISQRAIDTISSIGGGPTGVLSRGFLSVFEDFAYARLGMSCVLRDNVCVMGGVEPTQSKDGQIGYYLVKGRLLPRIDVKGYAQRVSWSNLIEQIKAAQASGGAQLK